MTAQLADKEAELRATIQARPDDVGARHKLAEVLGRLGKTADAVNEYATVAHAYASSGEALKAIAVCNLLLKLDPQHKATQSMLADLYAKRRGPEAKPSSPTSPGTPSALGKVAVKQLAVPAHIARLPQIPLFSELGRGPFLALAASTQLRQFKAGETIVREGEPGRSMFAVVRGEVRVVRQRSDDPDPQQIAVLSEGAFFGEIALLTHAPRIATVIAVDDTELLELTREQMDDVIRKHSSVGKVVEKFYRQRLLANLVAGSPLFKPLDASVKETIVATFKAKPVEKGSVLLEQGQASDGIFVLLRGQCEVLHNQTRIAELREGDVFGEISVVFDVPVTATVKTLTPGTVLQLEKSACQRLVLSDARVKELLTALGKERRDRILALSSA